MSTNLFEIVMQMLNFIILLLLMNKFLFRPLGAFLEKREFTIKSDLEQSESARKEAEVLIDEQKKSLNEAREEARSIREKAEEASKKERETVLGQAKADAAVLIENAKKEILLNVERAKQDVVRDMGRLSVELARNVLHREMQAVDHDGVLTEYLEKMKS